MSPLPRSAYHTSSTATVWKNWEETGPYADRLSELLESCRSHAIFLGWQIDSRFPLQTPWGLHETLAAKLERICKSNPAFHAYLLLWDHASFYIFEREKFQTRLWSKLHPRIHFVFDPRHPFGASHHEKIVLLDGKHGFCGGIDLCDKRRDYPEHAWNEPRRSLDGLRERHGPYHDRAVEVQGDIVREIHLHAEARWRRVSELPFPSAPPPGPPAGGNGLRVYLSRTASYPRPLRARFKRHVPHPRRRTGIIRENERLTLALIRLARESILIEGQYFWSRRVTRALVRKIHSMKGKRFEVRIILTDLTLLKALTRQMSAHGYALLGTLEQASKLAGTRLLVGHPHVPHPASPLDPRLTDKRKPVYVHSKVILVDDRFLSVGSTNLAARAFRVDSEVNLTCEALSADEKARLRAFRGALLSHWGLRSAGGLHERSSARIQVVSPLRELERWVLNHPLLSRLPWKALFDPEETWAAGFKRWFRRALPR